MRLRGGKACILYLLLYKKTKNLSIVELSGVNLDITRLNSAKMFRFLRLSIFSVSLPLSPGLFRLETFYDDFFYRKCFIFPKFQPVTALNTLEKKSCIFLKNRAGFSCPVSGNYTFFLQSFISFPGPGHLPGPVRIHRCEAYLKYRSSRPFSSSQASYPLLPCVSTKAQSFRCSSSPNQTRFAGL